MEASSTQAYINFIALATIEVGALAHITIILLIQPLYTALLCLMSFTAFEACRSSRLA